MSMIETPSSVSGTSFSDAIKNVRDAVVEATTTYYQTRAEIDKAKAASATARAQAAGQIASARTGLPSPSMLIYAGLGLAAIVLITRKR